MGVAVTCTRWRAARACHPSFHSDIRSFIHNRSHWRIIFLFRPSVFGVRGGMGTLLLHIGDVVLLGLRVFGHIVDFSFVA